MLMAQVAPQLFCPDRMISLYEIATGWISRSCRLLQAVARRERERENLVYPKTLSCRQPDLQTRHSSKDEEQHPALTAVALHAPAIGRWQRRVVDRFSEFVHKRVSRGQAP